MNFEYTLAFAQNLDENDVLKSFRDQFLIPKNGDNEIQWIPSNRILVKEDILGVVSLAESGLGIYALSAIIVDKAEPSEALKCNIAWSLGLENTTYLVSSKQIAAFRKLQKIF